MESIINIQNIVASTTLAEDFDLDKIEAGLEGAQYNKTKFSGLVYRIQNPKVCFLIFITGKVVCTGAKDVENVHPAIITLANTLKDIGCEKIDPEPEVHVQNIVASADLKKPLNLNAIVIAFGMENVEYEPEVFPRLVYRIRGSQVSSACIQLWQAGNRRWKISRGLRGGPADHQGRARELRTS